MFVPTRLRILVTLLISTVGRYSTLHAMLTVSRTGKFGLVELFVYDLLSDCIQIFPRALQPEVVARRRGSLEALACG